MRRLRIRFPEAELDLMVEAAGRFNESHGYLDEISVKGIRNQQVLLVSPAESAMFVESYLGSFSTFSKQRIRKDLIKEIKKFLEQEPNNLPALHSLDVLKSLSF